MTGGRRRRADGSAIDPAATVEYPLPAGPLSFLGDDALDTEATTPLSSGRYEFLGGDRDTAEIGRGGIGRVLLAFDRHLRREVAVKELKSPAVTHTQLSRFLREARVTGQLEHPGVVPVHELGHRPDGTLYYAMRLVRGRTLRSALDACGSLDERLELLPHFVDLCHTIAYAHSRGVIHRDIKPDNVMIGEFGETVVLDWGLARPLEAAPSAAVDGAPGRIAAVFESTAGGTGAGLTVDGSLLGTPAYISPEQALGDPAALDGCADIWSLGAVLHELLTGRPPFVDDTLQGLLVKVLADPVRPPRLLDPEIPADLSSICEKALERRRAARYGSARELAGEIEAFRSGRRVRAHDYTPWEHLVRFAVQKKGLIAAAGAVLAVVVAALVLLSLSYGAEKDARREAQAATERALHARAEERRERLRAGLHFAQGAAEKAGRLGAERRLLSARIYAAAALVQNPAHSRSPLAEAGFAGDDPAAAELALTSLGYELQARSETPVRVRRVLRDGEPLNGVAVSADGALLATVGKSGALAIRDARTGGLRCRLAAHRDTAWAVAFSPAGDLVATGGRDGRVRLARAADGEQVAAASAHEGDAFDLAFSPDGKLLASAGADGALRLWRVPGLEPAGRFDGHEGAVHGVAFSPDGGRLAGAGRDRTVRVWSLDRPAEPLVIHGHEAVVRDVAFSPDGTRLATGGYDKTVRVFDARSGAQLLILSGHEDEVLGVAFSPDGTRLLSTSWDRTARLWDASSGRLVAAIEGHAHAIWSGAFSRDGALLVTAGEDGAVRLYDLLRPPPLFAEPGQGYLWTVVHSPDGTLLATAGADGTVRLWRVGDGRLLRRLDGHRDVVAEVAFSPDGRWIASAGYDGTVRVHAVATGESRLVLAEHAGFVRSVAFSPDGRRLASGGHDGAVRLWDTGDGALLATLEQRGGAVRRVAFSADGERLAAACSDGNVRLWDAAGRTPAREIAVGSGILMGLAFSPSGGELAASDVAGTITIVDPSSGAVRSRLRRNDQDVYTVRWSPDGRLLAAAADDSTVTVWDPASGRPRLLFRLSQSVFAIDFSRDGGALVAGDSDTARTLSLDLGAGEADPLLALRDAEGDAGLRLEGFNLVQAP